MGTWNRHVDRVWPRNAAHAQKGHYSEECHDLRRWALFRALILVQDSPARGCHANLDTLNVCALDSDNHHSVLVQSPTSGIDIEKVCIAEDMKT